MTQSTVDGIKSPTIIHEGQHFKAPWKKFIALRIEATTDKAYLFVLDDKGGMKWLPKSVVRIEETAEGLLVKYPEWVT